MFKPVFLIATLVLLHSEVSFADATDDQMRAAVNELNKSAPIVIDHGSTLDHALYINRTIIYDITLTNISGTAFNTMSSAKRDGFKKDMVKAYSNLRCTETATRKILDLGITYKYVIHGNDYKQVLEYSVSKANCSKNG